MTQAYSRRDDEGFYTWEGVKYPSVTTILDSAPGKHLMPWYAKMAAKECAALAEEWESGRMSPDAAIADLCAWEHRMRAAERYRDHRGRIGSLTHHALYHSILEGRPIRSNLDDLILWLEQEGRSLMLYPEDAHAWVWRELIADALPYVRAGLDWASQCGLAFEAVGLEAAVFNLAVGYAGTMDAIASIDGKRTVIDFKTSGRIASQYRYQLEAYRRAEFIGLVADGSIHDLGETHGAAIVHIRPDSVDLIRYEPSDNIWRGFVGLTSYYRSLQEMPAVPATKPAPPRVVPAAKTSTREVPF